MDTKLKNKRLSLIALVLFISLSSLSLLTVLDLLENQSYLQKDNYFQSQQFYNEFSTFVDLIKAVHVDYADYDSWNNAKKIGAEMFAQLQQAREEYLRQVEHELILLYTPKIESAQKAGKQEEAAKLTQAKNAELAKVRQEQQQKIVNEMNEIIASKDQEVKDLWDSLSLRNESIKYYVEDKQNNKVYSNLDRAPSEAELRNDAMYSFRFPANSYQTYPFVDINRTFQVNQWKGVFYIPKKVEGYSQIHSDAIYYASIRERLLKECALLVVSSLAALLTFLYVRKQHVSELPIVAGSTAILRRIPLDVRIVLFVFGSLFTLLFGTVMPFFRLPIDVEQFVTFAFMCLGVAYLMLNGKEALLMMKDKELLRQQWESSLYRKISRLLKASFVNRNVLFKVGLGIVLTIGLGMSLILTLMALDANAEELLLLTVLYGLFYLVVVIPYILRRVGLLNKILRGAQEMAAGNLHTVIEETGSGNLAALAHHMNNIKQGLQQSLESQMKSERMKSELITNVSHDLKTPLTSIINYVDLLKRDNLSQEEVQSYVEVLERKTDRLKVLIDDLFEASRMASGAVELSLEQVNVAALLSQAIAECSDKIDESSLTFRVNIEKQNIYAYLDGKKTWRVFENLISNALKYSLPHTRVYVSLAEQADKVLLTMKNVSAYEIDFDVEEIFERFKRGDKSRNTEGSGLGLAIAKSIVELQGGRLFIEIDGDYFKAIVEFPKHG